MSSVTSYIIFTLYYVLFYFIINSVVTIIIIKLMKRIFIWVFLSRNGSLLPISSISFIWIHTFLHFDHFKYSETQQQSFETSGFICLETRINTAGDFNLQQYRCENIKLTFVRGLFFHVCWIIHSSIVQNGYNSVFLTRCLSVKSRSEQSRAFIIDRIYRYVMSILRFLIF